MNNTSAGKGARFIVFTWILLFSVSIFAQSPRDRQLEESAVKAFAGGKFGEALPGFSELLTRYPRDPMYNYYHGVCLVSLGREPVKAAAELRLASLGSVPGDVFFFLGKAAYMQNNYGEAIKYFERFREASDSRTRESYHVDRWINVSSMYLNNPQHKINPDDLTVSYRATLDTALKYQHKLDSVNYLITREQQTVRDSSEKYDRLNLLKEERDFYAGITSDYFSAVRKMEKSGKMNKQPDEENPSGTGKKDTKGGSPYLEQMGEQFYRQPGISTVFALPDQERLDQLSGITARGNKLMEEAQEINSDIARYQVVANAAGSRREAQQARKNIQRLEKKKMEKRMEAIGYFQAANDEKYALYNKYLDELLLKGNKEDAKIAQGKTFRGEAEKSHRKVLSLRDEAEKQKNAEKRYNKLMEANAYELIALDNQKKALGTIAGLVPVAGDKVDVTRPVAEIPETTIPRIKPPAQKQGNVKKKPTEQVTNESITVPTQEKTEIPVFLKDAKAKLTASSGTPAPSPANPRAAMLGKYPYGFALRQSLPYDDKHPIPVMEDLPEGVNYKIQIAAFSKQPGLSFFKGMYPLSKEDIPGKNIVRYYTGLFRKFDDALKALVEIRKMGFPDALIVGFYNGERSSLERIRWLEDEMPFENVSASGKIIYPPAAVTAEESQTKREPELVYRVQLGAFSRNVQEKKMEHFRILAGKYKVITTRNPKGNFVYSIGNFLTFEEAEAYRKKLLSEGIEGVFVTAWRNGKRISLFNTK